MVKIIKRVIVIINDRVTDYLKMEKMVSKEAEPLTEATIDLLGEWKPFLHTITAHNGKEFATHQKISQALKLIFSLLIPIILGKEVLTKI